MSKPRLGAPKRVAVGLLAGSLAMFGVALAPTAGATTTVTTERLAGTNRYGTAAAIAGDEAFAAPTHVVIATGQNFPDALAASTLTGSNGNAPIILTETATLTSEASTALDGLRTKNVTTAIIVGGTEAVSTAVQTAVGTKGFTVTRVAGTNRYETAAAIANAADARQDSGSVGGQKTALIATGTNFPDALAGGPAAHRNDLPLLLVDNTVPAATRTALTSLGITRAVILGGTVAVSEAVATEIGTIVGTAPTRLAGVNRYSTAVAVANYEIDTLAFPATAAILATGLNFPDALTAGPLGGQLGAPIVLVNEQLPTETRDFLDARSNRIAKLYIAGGTAVVSDAVVAAAKAAAETVANDTGTNTPVTARPELVSASIVNTVTSTQATPSQPAGTYVRYVFDEAITATVDPTQFFVNTAANVQTAGDAGSAVVESGGTAVVVRFGGIATAAGASAITVATVAPGAVRDATGLDNAEGDAAVGTASTTPTATAGVTTAPDLVGVAGFRQGQSNGQTAVDFTFDQAANVATPGGFHLVRTDGTVSNCTGPVGTATPSGGTVAGGGGTTTITVVCENAGVTVQAPNGTALSAANVARGYVDAGAVTGVTGNVPNPLEAHDVAGTSAGPDLASVTLTASTTGGNDSAVFTFDQAVLQATAGNFAIYQANGNQVFGTGTAAINPSNQAQVLVQFPANTVATAAGGNVLPGAVAGTFGGAVATNNADEEAAGGTGSNVQTPGATSGPDLTGVALVQGTDIFGNAGAFSGRYTFDEAVTSANPLLFFAYAADGTRYRAGSCTIGANATSTPSSSQVTCTGFVNVTTGVTATNAQSQSLVLGTVQRGAVTGSGGGADVNPIGGAPTTGGNGTPAS